MQFLPERRARLSDSVVCLLDGCSCWTNATSRTWRRSRPLVVHTWQLLVSPQTGRSVSSLLFICLSLLLSSNSPLVSFYHSAIPPFNLHLCPLVAFLLFFSALFVLNLSFFPSFPSFLLPLLLLLLPTRSARTAGTTSASWSSLLCPCRRR